MAQFIEILAGFTVVSKRPAVESWKSPVEPRRAALPDVVIEKPIALLEDVLAPWRERIGADFEGYKNHVSRMLNFCFALRPCSEEERHKLIIAGAFHDIGIWSDGTVDYLPPSIDQAKLYLTAQGLTDWIAEVEIIIDLHHKVLPYRGVISPLIEIFRKADLADFSLGVVKGGVPGATVRAAKAAYPNAGFHRRLVRQASAESTAIHEMVTTVVCSSLKHMDFRLHVLPRPHTSMSRTKPMPLIELTHFIGSLSRMTMTAGERLPVARNNTGLAARRDRPPVDSFFIRSSPWIIPSHPRPKPLSSAIRSTRSPPMKSSR